MASSATNLSSNKQDQTVFLYRNWTEIVSKHSYMKQNSSLVEWHIPALNSYTSAISLQDPVLNKNHVIVIKELGLPGDVQREELQTESVNVEASCGHHIPVLMVKSVLQQLINHRMML
jgi:hypothetical protein